MSAYRGSKGVKLTKAEKGSQLYVLRSVLPSKLQDALATPQDLPELTGPTTADGAMSADSGAPLRWEASDASAIGAQQLVGLRTIILCLILANGRQISGGMFSIHAFPRFDHGSPGSREAHALHLPLPPSCSRS